MRSIVKSINEIKRYLNGVKKWAKHPTGNVPEVIIHLVQVVILYHDEESIECRTYKDDPINILYFKIDDVSYILRYEHSDKELIELKQEDKIVASFTNSNTFQDVWNVFKQITGY